LSDLRPEQAAAVTKLTERAFDLLGRAIRLEPRLIQVDVELAELGLLLGRPDIVAGAERHAASLDPGCAALAQGLMGMMWRQGEFGRFLMREYAAGLKAQLGRSAQLAEAVALPSVLEGRDLLTEGKRKEAALLLEEAARQGASSETLALLAKAMPDLPGRARSERLQVLLQAGRFGADDVATGLERGRALVRAGEHEWALRALERTLAREPGKWEVHTLLALANGYLKRHAEAEAHLLKVMQHPPARESALHSLMTTMREAGEWSKAAHYAALVVREQPRALDAWQILGVARFRSGDRAGARAAFESLLHRFDLGDPTMAPQLYWTRRAIAWLQDPDGAESRPEGL
jgi:tetratricopeptide (TPR) repeat protein